MILQTEQEKLKLNLFIKEWDAMKCDARPPSGAKRAPESMQNELVAGANGQNFLK